MIQVKFALQIMVTLSLLFILRTAAQANAGLPVIIIVWPVFGLLLIPIIVIESWITVKMLHDSHDHTAIKRAVWKANVCSYALLALVPIAYIFGFPSIPWMKA